MILFDKLCTVIVTIVLALLGVVLTHGMFVQQLLADRVSCAVLLVIAMANLYLVVRYGLVLIERMQ